MRKGLLWTLGIVLVLGVGGYFGDNWLRAYAQDRAVETFAAFGPDDATVELGGTPFFLSVITRSVPSAHVTVSSAPLVVATHPVTLTDIVADTGTVKLGANGMSLATITATARLSYEDLSKIADVPVSYAKDGRLQLRYKTEVLGRELAFAISALPEADVEAQVIRLSDPKLDLAGNTIDLGLTQDQIDGLVDPIKVQLEYGLRLTGITPDKDGVAIAVDGNDVEIPLP